MRPAALAISIICSGLLSLEALASKPCIDELTVGGRTVGTSTRMFSSKHGKVLFNPDFDDGVFGILGGQPNTVRFKTQNGSKAKAIILLGPVRNGGLLKGMISEFAIVTDSDSIEIHEFSERSLLGGDKNAKFIKSFVGGGIGLSEIGIGSGSRIESPWPRESIDYMFVTNNESVPRFFMVREGKLAEQNT